MDSKWIKITDKLPPFDEEIQVTYDNGKTVDDSVEYMEERTCMLAGVSGGSGYFGEGFATSGKNGTDRGLIVDDPTHWRTS